MMNAGSHQVEEDSAHLHAVFNFSPYLPRVPVCVGSGFTCGAYVSCATDTITVR